MNLLCTAYTEDEGGSWRIARPESYLDIPRILWWMHVTARNPDSFHSFRLSKTSSRLTYCPVLDTSEWSRDIPVQRPIHAVWCLWSKWDAVNGLRRPRRTNRERRLLRKKTKKLEDTTFAQHFPYIIHTAYGILGFTTKRAYEEALVDIRAKRTNTPGRRIPYAEGDPIEGFLRPKVMIWDDPEEEERETASETLFQDRLRQRYQAADAEYQAKKQAEDEKRAKFLEYPHWSPAQKKEIQRRKTLKDAHQRAREIAGLTPYINSVIDDIKDRKEGPIASSETPKERPKTLMEQYFPEDIPDPKFGMFDDPDDDKHIP